MPYIYKGIIEAYLKVSETAVTDVSSLYIELPVELNFWRCHLGALPNRNHITAPKKHSE